jgi:tetratricopeptide (TPR) repeat protein
MSKTTRAFSAALLMGAALLTVAGLSSPTPALAGAAPAFRLDSKDKALFDAVTGAQADARAGRFAEAIAKAREADGMPNKPTGLSPALHQMIVGWAVQAKDYPTALAQVERMIAANEGNKIENIKQALSLAAVTKNQAKMTSFANDLGGNLDATTRLFIADSIADAGQLREALAYAAPVLDTPNPPEDALNFKQNLMFRMNDPVGRRAALEQLVATYPKLTYWHDLLQLARNEKGLDDEQRLDIFRLRLAVNDLKTDADYQEMAQQALVAGYPAEAKTALDKATAAKLLQGERAGRLVKMTADRVAADGAVQTELQKKAATDPNSALKLGSVYRSFGKHKEAEEQIRKAIATRKLTDPEAAKIALGHALLAQGKKQEAVDQYNSVARTSKQASLARLWSIYARRA